MTGVLDLLLRHGASPNVADYYGDTALHMAYALDHLDGVALLLGARADANVVDADGYAPEQVRAVRLPVWQASDGGRGEPPQIFISDISLRITTRNLHDIQCCTLHAS